MKNKLSLLFLPLLLMSSCSNSKNEDSYSLFVKVNEIETNTESIELYVDQTFTLEASIKPTNATIKKILFESDNSSVATISSTGVVRGKKQGKCSIVISADDNNEFKKTIPVTVKREDRNRQKDGTILITTNLDLTSLASGSEESTILDNLNLNNSEIYAPITNTYNTTDEDYMDLSDSMKILSDINYYGNIEGETNDQRNERIYNNMKVLFGTSFAMNTLLMSTGASDSTSYSNYYQSISSRFLILSGAYLLGKTEFNNAIIKSPEQHSLTYINQEYFSNARLEQTSTTKNCTFYSYQENDAKSNSSISSLSVFLNYLNVNDVKANFTQENINKLVEFAKNIFDKLPASYSFNYELIRVLINSIDENSYQVSTSDIYQIDNKDAVDLNINLTSSGLNSISIALVDFITLRISTADNEGLKNRITNYISGLNLTNLSNTLTIVNRESGGGIDICKVEFNATYNTNNLSAQSINVLLNMKTQRKEIPSTFFMEEEVRQTSYRNS